MLCDEVVSTGASGGGCDISCLLPKLRAAQKFSLSPDFAAVADALSADYRGLTRAFEHCRLPYRQTWIEVAASDRPQFNASPLHAPDIQTKPKRVGFLLEATRDDMSAWTAHLFWSGPKSNLNIPDNHGCSCAPMAVKFDMLHSVDNFLKCPSDDELLEGRRHLHPVIASTMPNHPGWNNSDDSVRLMLLNHTRPIAAEFGLPHPIAFGVPPEQLNEFYSLITSLARSDWAGEVGYILAVIGLLNARNAVEMQTVDNTEFNRKRIKRGRLPLFSHKVLKIAHRQVKRVYGESGHRGDYAPMRGHFVRGHWKVRKSGIFFWHPFTRGDFARGTVVKDYELT